uniref:Mitochondrial import inner membrane translocase subunit TIM22 n=1 Tax=Pseudo-nitzschia australis TaxID=44445 RepID=A0A7S4EEM4_9STRA
MARNLEHMLRVAVTFAIVIVPALAGGSYLPTQYYTCSPFIGRSCSYSRSRRSNMRSSPQGVSTTFLVSRKLSERTQKGDRRREATNKIANEESDLAEASFKDLGPIGKTIAGCTEIVVSTVLEYFTGYLQGFFFGTLVGGPGFLFRPIEKGVAQPFTSEISNRFARMNTRSKSWGKNFGSISAAFGGFGVAVKVLRNGEEDAWNSIMSSAAAGAFFERKSKIRNDLLPLLQNDERRI